MDIIFTEPGTLDVVSLGCATAMEIARESGADVYWWAGERDRQQLLFQPPRRPSAIFVSIYSPRQYPVIHAALKRLGVAARRDDRGPGDPLVVIGGQAVTANPGAIWDFADIVAAGDGEATIPPIVEALEAGRERILMAASCTPGLAVPGTNEFVAPAWSTLLTARFVRSCSNARYGQIEISRGCRGSCAFCQLGHVVPYREIEYDAIIRLLDQWMPRRVNLFAPSFSDHRRSDDLARACVSRGIRLTNRNSQAIAPEQKQALTIGADAPSERIRRAIGKRIWRESDIIHSVSEPYSEAKINFIIGYPGETDMDLDECAAAIRRIIDARGHRATYIYAALLIPYPHTAFDGMVSEVSSEWERAYRWIITQQRIIAEINNGRAKRNLRFFSPPTPARALMDTKLAWTGQIGGSVSRLDIQTISGRTRRKFDLGMR